MLYPQYLLCLQITDAQNTFIKYQTSAIITNATNECSYVGIVVNYLSYVPSYVRAFHNEETEKLRVVSTICLGNQSS